QTSAQNEERDGERQPAEQPDPEKAAHHDRHGRLRSVMCPLRGGLSFFLHQAAKLEGPAAYPKSARPIGTADCKEQVGHAWLEGGVVGERQLEYCARLAAPELLAVRPRLQRAGR